MAARRNLFLAPDALEIVMSNSDPVAFTNTVLTSLSNNSMFVTKEDVMRCLQGEVIFESPKEIKPHNKVTSEIKILDDSDITGNSTCEGTIDDFFRLFQNRYMTLKKIIERRSDFGPAKKIKDAVTMYDRPEVRVIGMISEVKKTPNGHVLLTIEDDGGDKNSTCKIVISKESEDINTVFVTDEVIGVVGMAKKKTEDAKTRWANSMPSLIAKKIVKPDVPNAHKWVPSDSDSRMAVLSDIHIGSTTFLQKDWDKMISWLKENSEKMNINYLLIPGDEVDGIGVFPDQEKELVIKDIYKQYSTLSEYLKDIPDNIKIVMHPGNHDACRLAEPQPALNGIFTKTFDSNVMMIGNPVSLEIEGRRVLTYHGKSFDDWIASVQQLKYDNPLDVMNEMVRSRHMAPIFGMKNALAPEKKDYLAMTNVPDIFVTGHVHKFGYRDYKGVKMINASTWQSQTEYQKMHNFNPDPSRMPVIHLGTGAVELKNFSF